VRNGPAGSRAGGGRGAGVARAGSRDPPSRRPGRCEEGEGAERDRHGWPQPRSPPACASPGRGVGGEGAKAGLRKKGRGEVV